MASLRTGIGVDVHPLVQGRPLVLGGISIPSEKGIQGHSDGDVLTHSIIDALLGAANLGDIGTWFPSSRPGLEGISSLAMLEKVLDLLGEEGYHLVNIDATIILEAPRLSDYLPAMKRQLSETLACAEECISVKATTTDHLGFIGAGEGIAALATVLIER